MSAQMTIMVDIIETMLRGNMSASYSHCTVEESDVQRLETRNSKA